MNYVTLMHGGKCMNDMLGRTHVDLWKSIGGSMKNDMHGRTHVNLWKTIAGSMKNALNWLRLIYVAL